MICYLSALSLGLFKWMLPPVIRGQTIARNLLALSRARWIVCPAMLLAVLGWQPSVARARVRLENICSIQGQQEQKLLGMGLIVGLKGTGDGGKFLPTIRALAAALRYMDNPIDGAVELKDVNNVALVLVEATVPAGGIRRGQKVDCFVSSIGAAKSLVGGRLMSTPLGGQMIKEQTVMGLAAGPLLIEDGRSVNSGRISQGVVIQQDVVTLFIENHEFKLLLDAAHSSFQAASEIARVVNADISFEANGRQLARAVSPGVIQVVVPEQYRQDPVQFVAQVLDVGIDNPHTQARVVVNSKTGVIVVTGEVEISPVVISHKNLSVAVGGDEAADAQPPTPGVGFVPLLDQQGRQSPQRLKSLVDALNQLKVPTPDVIEIIKDLHRSGKLHAVLITE